MAAYAATILCILLIADRSLAREPGRPDRSLAQVLLPAIDAHRGDVGVAIKHLETGESFEHQADRPMPTASLIKFPIMVAAYDAVERGELSLDELIELQEDDKVPGSGVLTRHFSPGAQIPLRDAIHLMMVYSDNTATNLVLDKLGLPTTNELMDSFDLPETRIHSKVFRRDTSIAPERSRQFGLGSTTARDMVKLAELLQARSLVTEQASEQMLEHMFACESTQKTRRLLPSGTRVAHKGGSVSATRTDAGIMETPGGAIAFCILTTNNKDQSWSDDNEGDLLCAQIGLAVHEYFNADGEATPAPIARTLEIGAQGELVTALQRTLNARIESSPGIGVDGDFGPETEGAVKRFQDQEGLPATGVVDADTWRALGPLRTEDDPVQETVAAEDAADAADGLPADALDGPPFVTAQAWAVIDGATGQLLAGGEEDTKRDPASTTKMMTAYLVTSLAEDDPTVLEEVVTFSQRAAKTSGSSSALKEGEQLPVGELLYGLMLPSGNDASVALAEHFGQRMADKAHGNGNPVDAYDGFIQAMNRQARELGMDATRFNNPHGLPSEGHQTTARDLAKLAFAAYQQPLFRQIVSTPRRATTVESVSGYRREVVWRNTNRLLRIGGYDGIKTGTTRAAGACLVSTSERNQRRLIVVVLGATSTDARYTDTRNLFRWAWRDLMKIGGNGP